MDFRIPSTFGFSNQLVFSASLSSKAMLVDFDAASIDAPKLSLSSLSKLEENFFPNAIFAPLLPSCISRSVRGEDGKSSPGASLPKTVE